MAEAYIIEASRRIETAKRALNEKLMHIVLGRVRRQLNYF
mgnify:CR=1 FL=1